MTSRVSKIDGKNITGINSGGMADNHQIVMQPHYLGDLSKTSRTLGAEENESLGQNFRNNGHTIPTNNSVIRRAPRIHRRNRVRRIPYYQRMRKVGQRVII